MLFGDRWQQLNGRGSPQGHKPPVAVSPVEDLPHRVTFLAALEPIAPRASHLALASSNGSIRSISG